MDATPAVPALLRNRPSKRPCADPEDPQPFPEHATVIAPTWDGRCESVVAENPAPTIGTFDAEAVKAGSVQPQPPEMVALKDAVWLVKLACTLPDIAGVPVAPG